jgi:hypothetical protein
MHYFAGFEMIQHALESQHCCSLAVQPKAQICFWHENTANNGKCLVE